MDRDKRNRLVAKYRNDPHQVVPVQEFFDGNDDAGSIGCNLRDHPGIDTFAQGLTSLLTRSDVQAAYVVISELDPGEDFWPFADTVFVVGSIASDDLLRALSRLNPDEVGLAPPTYIPASLSGRRVVMAWWD